MVVSVAESSALSVATRHALANVCSQPVTLSPTAAETAFREEAMPASDAVPEAEEGNSSDMSV